MARDRRVFEEAMRAGANAAWDKSWDRAIAAYQRALTEYPSDVNALTGLGLAYSGVGQWGAALESYLRASELAPDDPVLHEHLGRVREQMGQGKEAAEAYLEAAERYLNQRQAPHLALERWKDAVRVYPDCLRARVQMLQYYHRHGHVRDAVRECLALARIYQAQSQHEHALQICNYALRLAPHDPDVLTALDKLRYGEETSSGPQAEVVQEESVSSLVVGEPGGPAVLDFAATPAVEVGEKQGSPVEITLQKALTDLAESFFDEEETAVSDATRGLSKVEADVLIGRALDFQTRGKVQEAVAVYEQAIAAGVEWPAVHFNLGLLYQEQAQFDAAVAQFERVTSEPEYALGSHFALGECYRALGRIDEALRHFVEALKIVDLATVRSERTDKLARLYESMASGHLVDGEREHQVRFINSVVEFLGREGWKDVVVQARRQLDSLSEEEPVLSLAEMLALPDSARILESVALAQEYVERGLFYAALEENYCALGLAPTYLPIHWQLAHLLIAMGKVDGAVSKFLVIADTYRMRGDVRSAMDMYRRALDLASMDTGVRAKLIDMLITHGEIDEALEHYLILADSYQHLAQMDKACETYQKALQLAPRGSPGRGWQVCILHKLGDIYMQLVDWRRAIGVYEQIRKLAPDDERARSALMELYYRVDRPELAIVELDHLLDIYRETGQTQRVFTVLEDAVHDWPDSLPLRTRLAQVHLDAGNVEQALEHLDKLGDLQLEAGRYEDARATIQAIIALQPPNVATYRQLLDQISG